MAVTAETESGTMAKAKGRSSKVSPSTEAKTPGSGSSVSPEEEEPRIYTQKQADALVQAAKSEVGRRVKDIETERDTHKMQSEDYKKKHDAAVERMNDLTKQMEELTKDHPEGVNWVKKFNELQKRLDEVTDRDNKLTEREKTFAEREKKVNAFEFDVLIETIADEYEDGNSAQLKTALSGFENPKEEQIRNIAGIFWKKKAAIEGGEPESPKAPMPFPGKSEGGGGTLTRADIAKMSPEERSRRSAEISKISF